MSTSGYITNVQRCSTEDGPGIRTTVFLKGCPLTCIWCHNIETISPKPQLVWHSGRCIGDQSCVMACPESALELTSEGMIVNNNLCRICGTCEDVCPTTALEIIGKEWTADSLVDELIRDKVFFDTSNGGVTLSGGEALFQNTFARELAVGLKEKGIHVALDTCGYASESVLEEILPYVDLVLYDLKQMDSDRHIEFTGVPLDRVISNLKLISDSKVPIWIRTPIIPGYTDSKENILSISKFIVENLPTVERYDLLAFNNLCIEKYALFGLQFPLHDVPLVERLTMETLVSIARDVGIPNVCWSGMTRRESNSTDKSQSRMEVARCD